MGYKGFLQLMADSDQELQEVEDDLQEWIERLKKRQRRSRHKHRTDPRRKPLVNNATLPPVIIPGYGNSPFGG